MFFFFFSKCSFDVSEGEAIYVAFLQAIECIYLQNRRCMENQLKCLGAYGNRNLRMKIRF